MPKSPTSAALSPPLTRRQTDVLQLLLRGLGNREIATQYAISERAVRVHVTSLLRKYAVASRAALIATVLSAPPDGAGRRRTMSARTRARALRARFRAYETAPFAVAVTSGPEHRYVFCNELAARVAGRARERIVGRTVKAVFPDLSMTYSRALDSVYRTGIPGRLSTCRLAIRARTARIGTSSSTSCSSRGETPMA